MLLKFKALLGIFIVTVITLMFFVISFAENITYTYDDLGRLIKVDYGNGISKEYKYDDAGNRVELLSAQKISVSPTSHDFGSINIGNSSVPQTFTISNTGTKDLVISSIGTTGGDAGMFSVAMGGTNPCPSLNPTITPGSNCTITVTFSPTSVGPKSTNLRINSDDPDTPSLDVPLSGTGVAKPMVECNLVPDATVIPRGGILGIQMSATNNTVQSQTFLFATFVIKPGGNRYPASGWLFGPVSVTLSGNGSRSGHKSHNIPTGAPLGTYTYHGYVGNYGVGIYDECWFNFTVTQ